MAIKSLSRCNNAECRKHAGNKSQSVIEFVVLVSFMLTVFLLFFSVSGYKLLSLKAEKNRDIAKNFMSTVENEIKTASSVNDGYRRTFDTPPTIDGSPYNLTILKNRELILYYMDEEHVSFLPSNICGDMFVGVENEIGKEKSNVCVNSCWTSVQCTNMENLSLCADVEGTFPGTKCWCCNLNGKCCT